MPFQNHVHIDTVIGGSPENAPTLQWTLVKRQPTYQVFGSFQRAITGKLLVQIASDASGNILQFGDLEYVVKCDSETEKNTLVGMLGKTVKVVDIYHANDGADHTSDIRTMVFAQVLNVQPPADHIDVFYLVTIVLMDADTV